MASTAGLTLVQQASIIACIESGLSWRQTAKQLGVSLQTISKYKKQYVADDNRTNSSLIERLKRSIAGKFLAKSAEFMDNITQDKLDKADAKSLMLGSAIAYDKFSQAGNQANAIQHVITVNVNCKQATGTVMDSLQGMLDSARQEKLETTEVIENDDGTGGV